MYSQVASPIAFLDERLLARVALEGSFSFVDQHVSLQMPRLNETLVTDLALMWLFTRMDKLMPLQTPLSRERLIADAARVHRCCGSVDALNHWRLQSTLCCSTR